MRLPELASAAPRNAVEASRALLCHLAGRQLRSSSTSGLQNSSSYQVHMQGTLQSILVSHASAVRRPVYGPSPYGHAPPWAVKM